MTEVAQHLRDARLRQALAHAPDAQALPMPVTRLTVRDMAQAEIAASIAQPATQSIGQAAGKTDAVADHQVGSQADHQAPGQSAATPTRRPLPWWKRLWADAGRTGAPWPAAFATVVLGVVITIAWQGQDVPDAVPDRVAAIAPEGAPAVPAAPAVTTVAPPAPTPAPVAPTPVPESSSARTATGAAQAQANMAADAPPVARDVALEGSKRRPAAKAAPEPAPSPPGRSGAVAVQSPPATAADTLAKSSAEARAQALPPALASAPAPAPRAAAAASPSAPAAAAAMQRSVSAGWASAELHYLGRSKNLAAPELRQLANRLEALTASAAPTSADGLTGAPELRVRLKDAVGGQVTEQALGQVARPQSATAGSVSGSASGPVVDSISGPVSGSVGSSEAAAMSMGEASFELWGNVFRWRRAGRPDVTGIATPETLAALRAELSRVLAP